MQIIPVLDIRKGQAVRAVAGDRAHYGPLRSVLHEGTDPVALAKAGRDAWNLPDLYIADLDAILGEAAPDIKLYHALSELGLTLWIDAGVRDASDVPRLIEAGVDRVIVGLETVRGPEALAEILAEFGPNRLSTRLEDRSSPRDHVDDHRHWSDPSHRARPGKGRQGARGSPVSRSSRSNNRVVRWWRDLLDPGDAKFGSSWIRRIIDRLGSASRSLHQRRSSIFDIILCFS
jgi:hypothetical protein